jgi:phage terminase large subunit-like protein
MWLPSPEPGTSICAGFDGSENDDWTAIKAETRSGLIFTPRWGPDRRPTIWNPVEHDGRIPRGQLRTAWAELIETYDVRRVYCDPGFHDETSYESEIEEWALEFPLPDGKPERFLQFPTTSSQRMYPAIRRFESDLRSGSITHDGCPITAGHMRNARKIGSRGRTYTLGKPAAHQKIDAAVTSVLAHEAAADERAAGWPEQTESKVIVFTR